ncbi:DUF402 domain-containing protein [Kitasatospora purpeofusca]|uniref:DUF402 domain-containing protein n=1 Tax=Kitasatospora purpeofusca TaxID=67352 RepID=UPI0035D69F48
MTDSQDTGAVATVNLSQIGQRVGVGRAAVANWRRRATDFPLPVGGTDESPEFREDQVAKWLRDNGKVTLPGPAAPPARVTLPSEPTVVLHSPDTGAPFAPGATVVRRDVHLDRVWSAQPHRAISDTGTLLEIGYWPGIRALAPTTWTAALRTGDDTSRKDGLVNLAAGTWQLETWAWRDTVVRSRFETDQWFSLHHFQSPDGEPLRLYVNFERPLVRTSIGIDTLDLLVDLVVGPDLSSWRWKDEDEYAHGRRLGFITDADHRAVDQARERALGLLQDRAGPFAAPWPAWAPDPAWPLPALPDSAHWVAP